ncbi:MAG: hypothetical protein JWM21_4221 [Acidobacteria bacterium]|nr:hypothetical protein [Acidobacteriota bacterium]
MTRIFKSANPLLWVLTAALAVLCIPSLPSTAHAQSDEPASRQIVLDEFTRARPPAALPRPQATVRPGPRRVPVTAALKARYMRKTPALLLAMKPGFETMEIGVTIWRLRPASGNDGSARVLVMEDARTTQWTPQRIEADTPLPVGERVRLSIESPRSGYLYVIDREQYADGSLGDPYLIFPTRRTRGGDNEVRPGRLIDIPAQEDSPSYFTLVPSPSRSDQVAEILSVVVSPERLAGLPITDKPLKLSKSDVAKWERTWSSEVERFEMVDGAGKHWTRVEQEASATASSRLLTQEEPAPQTIYRIGSRNKNAFLVTVPLRYGKP